jgi:hypothetical protein
MAQVHLVLRDAIEAAPRLFGSAVAGGQERVELVAGYYANVLDFLKVHHEGEDALIWPTLCDRVPDQADEVRRIAGQHHAVLAALDAATECVAELPASADEPSASAAAAAVAVLGAALVPHLDEEESFIVPLAARHIFAPEWGQLPSHTMRDFSGDRLWLIIGLIREKFRPDQIAMMEAHMPPPVLGMWQDSGQAAFTAFMTELRQAA